MKTILKVILITIFLTGLTANADTPRILRAVGDPAENYGPFGVDEDSLIGYAELENLEYFWTDPNPWDDKYYNVRFTSPFDRFQLLEVHIPLFVIPENLGGPIGEPSLRIIIWQSGDQHDESGYPADGVDSLVVNFGALSFSTDTLIINEISLSDLDPIVFYRNIDFHIGVAVIENEETDQVDTLAIYSDFVNGEDRSTFWDSREEIWKKTNEIRIGDYRRSFNYGIYTLVEYLGVPYILEPDGTVKSLTIDSVYPNPFNQHVQIHFNVQPGLLYSAVLYDNLGRELRTIGRGIGGGKENLSLTGYGLTAGTYYLRIFAEDKSVSQRLIFIK